MSELLFGRYNPERVTVTQTAEGLGLPVVTRRTLNAFKMPGKNVKLGNFISDICISGEHGSDIHDLLMVEYLGLHRDEGVMFSAETFSDLSVPSLVSRVRRAGEVMGFAAARFVMGLDATRDAGQLLRRNQRFLPQSVDSLNLLLPGGFGQFYAKDQGVFGRMTIGWKQEVDISSL